MTSCRLSLACCSIILILAGCDGPSSPVAPPQSAAHFHASARLTPHPLGQSAAPAGYYEYLPPGYGDGAPRPLLVYLNGFAQNGDGSAVELGNLLQTGIPELISSNRWPADRPFVVLAPQHVVGGSLAPAYAHCKKAAYLGTCWMTVEHATGNAADGAPCATPEEVHAFLAYAIAKYDVDPRRVYLTGISCGAYAAYEYVAKYGAAQIAALVTISGDARPAWDSAGCKLGAVPIWGFHGDADGTVDPVGTKGPLTALKASCLVPRRQAVTITIYPGVGHDAWTRTYDLSAGHDIYAWLLGFSRP